MKTLSLRAKQKDDAILSDDDESQKSNESRNSDRQKSRRMSLALYKSRSIHSPAKLKPHSRMSSVLLPSDGPLQLLKRE